MKYVGSRYVPKFMGTYDATQIYEALCVVDNGSGTSYISQKIVPAGTPLTNTSYWAVYGATSGAIINLQNQIDDMKDGTISGSLQYQINNNKKNIDLLKDKKIVWIGDSYMVPAGLPSTDSFARRACGYMGLVENVDYFISASPGYGFARPSMTFQSLLENITISIDDDDVTDVIVCGGANDGDYTANVYTAIGSFVTASKTRFPNAKISICAVDWTMGNGTYYKDIIAAYQYGAALYGCAFADGIYMAQHHTGWKQADGHPNQAGQFAIAYAITNFILTGHIAYPTQGEIVSPLTAGTDVTFDSTPGCVTYLSDKMCGLRCGGINVTLNTPMASGGGGLSSNIEIATLSGNTAYAGTTDGHAKHLSYCRLTDSSNNEHYVMCVLYVQSRHIIANVLIPTAMTITKIRFYNFDFMDNCFDC